MLQDEFRLVVIQDQHQACPYLPGVTARMPLQLPVGKVTPIILDQLLMMGFRRSGDFVYRTHCPTCRACEPTRINVNEFRLSKSFQRVLKRGDQNLICRLQRPTADRDRVKLFNQHRCERNLGLDEGWVDEDAYHSFLASSCCETMELAVYKEQTLVAVSIFDVAQRSTSAVYTHFAPEHHRYSLGTYAVLKQIEWARETERQFVYLGMYVAENRHLNYKARFQPQQRLIDGKWVS